MKTIPTSAAHPQGAAASGLRTRSSVDAAIDRAAAGQDPDPRVALREATTAYKAASRLRYQSGTAKSACEIAVAQWKLGDFGNALDWFGRALIAARRIRNKAVEARAANGLGATYDRLGDYQTALAYFERTATLNDATRDPALVIVAAVNVGHVLERMGRLDDAAQRYRDALRRVGQTDLPGRPMLLLNLGVIDALQERHREALDKFDLAVAGFDRHQRELDAALARCNRATARSVLGDHDGAVADLTAAGHSAARLGAIQLQWRALAHLGLAFVRAGRLTEAIETLQRALSFSETCRELELLRLNHQHLSEAFEAAGDPASALAHLKTAMKLQNDAHAQAATRQAQLALEETKIKTRRKQQVLPRHARIPEKPAAKAVRIPLNGEQLTPRECAVLVLIARGLSNREIGETLAISSNTARFHVSSLFGKLGVAKRSEAVAIAVRRGLLDGAAV